MIVLVVSGYYRYFRHLNYEPVLIVTYHCVMEEPYGGDLEELFVLPSEFEKQLKYWQENGWQSYFADEIDKIDFKQKALIITFDDGYADNYDIVLPLLAKYDMKATVFMVASFVGDPYFLNEAQLKAMSASGHIRIGSHTWNHRNLSLLTEEEIKEQLTRSQNELAKICEQDIRTIAYPYGGFNDKVAKLAAEYYDYGYTSQRGIMGYNPHKKTTIDRVSIKRSYDMEKIIDITEKVRK